MSNPTTPFSWQMPTATDLVTDLPADFEVFGQAVATSMADLLGGTTGQVLSKTTNTDMDFTWTTPTDQTPLTTKGDLFTFTTVDARLGVGVNGTVLTADSGQATGLGWTRTPNASNPLINSAFQIWQRGTSIAIPAATSTYSADRWTSYRTAAGSTVSRQVTNDVTNLAGIQYCARVQRDSGNTSTAIMYFTQAIESVNTIPLANQRITYSFWARAGANYSAASSVLTSAVTSGTGTDQPPYGGYTGSSTFATGSHTLTTTWTRFTVTGDVPNNASEMLIQFTNTPVGTAGANDYYEITAVQINIGSVSLPFRTYDNTIQGELAACQRYYISYTSSDGSITSGFATGTTNAYRYGVYLPTSMRTTPSASSVGTLILYDGAATTNITGIGSVRTLTSSGNVNAVSVDFTVASGLTQYRPYMLLIQSATFILSAEL
jgi:hypothetical protein